MNNFTKDLGKSLITTSLVGLVIAVNSSAYANENKNYLLDQMNFYFGAGVGYNQYNLSKDFKNKIEQAPNNGSVKHNSADLLIPILGAKFQENYGIEFGYQYHRKLKFSGIKSGNLQIRNAYLDAMGYMPVASKIDLTGGLGIGRASMETESALLPIGNGNKYNKFGFRIKVGAQYYINNSYSVRGLLGYQRVGDQSGKQSIKSIKYSHLDFIYIV